jgi:predicted transcriptional regulator
VFVWGSILTFFGLNLVSKYLTARKADKATYDHNEICRRSTIRDLEIQKLIDSREASNAARDKKFNIIIALFMDRHQLDQESLTQFLRVADGPTEEDLKATLDLRPSSVGKVFNITAFAR